MGGGDEEITSAKARLAAYIENYTCLGSANYHMFDKAFNLRLCCKHVEWDGI